MITPIQKIVAISVLVALNVIMFAFNIILGILAFFVLLPGVFAVLRL